MRAKDIRWLTHVNSANKWQSGIWTQDNTLAHVPSLFHRWLTRKEAGMECREGISGPHECSSSQIKSFFPPLGMSRRPQVLSTLDKVFMMTNELTKTSPSSNSSYIPPLATESTLWPITYIHLLLYVQLLILTSTNVSLLENQRPPTNIFKDFITKKHKMLGKLRALLHQHCRWWLHPWN